jgi:hypothetical protein
MKKKVYKIDHSTNNFKIYNADNALKSKASWFLEFGKTSAEVYDLKNKITHSISKKFKFWKWRISFTITDSKGGLTTLHSVNKENSIYEFQFEENIFKIHMHYYQKQSIFKNNIKIAEINDSFLASKEENTSNLLLSDSDDLEIIFLLFTCLKTGETHQKSIIKSQKALIPLEDNWNS